MHSWASAKLLNGEGEGLRTIVRDAAQTLGEPLNEKGDGFRTIDIGALSRCWHVSSLLAQQMSTGKF